MHVQPVLVSVHVQSAVVEQASPLEPPVHSVLPVHVVPELLEHAFPPANASPASAIVKPTPIAIDASLWNMRPTP